MKLYHHPMSRSLRPRLLLEELGVDFEEVFIDLKAGAHKQPAYLAINPLGQLPALSDAGVTINESVGICLYLAHAYGEGKFMPQGGAALARYYQWAAFVPGTIEARVTGYYVAKRSGDEAQVAAAVEKLNASFQMVADTGTPSPWLLGEQFTVADILVGSTMMWLAQQGTATIPESLLPWIGALSQRPAWQRVFASMGG